jgi:hypothetical protein
LELDNLGTFLVTGVMEQSTQKSHIDFEGYASMSSVPALEKSGKLEANSVNWLNIMCGYTYILLKKEASSKQLLTALNKITTTLNLKMPTTNRGSNLVFSQLLVSRPALNFRTALAGDPLLERLPRKSQWH